MTAGLLSFLPTNDQSDKKEKALCRASKAYMEGHMSLQDLRDAEKKNSSDYASASLKLVGLGGSLIGGLRRFFH